MNSCPITLWGRCIERWSNPASYPTAMAGYENLAGFRPEPGPDVISGATLVITAGRCYVHTASNVMFRILHHCHDSALCHILGLRTQVEAMTPNSNSAEIFVQCTYSQSFIILCSVIQKLPCWQTHPQTNKQTDLAENVQPSSLGYDAG